VPAALALFRHNLILVLDFVSQTVHWSVLINPTKSDLTNKHIPPKHYHELHYQTLPLPNILHRIQDTVRAGLDQRIPVTLRSFALISIPGDISTRSSAAQPARDTIDAISAIIADDSVDRTAPTMRARRE